MGEKEYLSLEEVADMLGVTYDLAAYLEEKKREAGGGGVCSVCGEVYRSRLSLKHTCQHDGCEEPICNDCWTRRGVRFCKAHQPK